MYLCVNSGSSCRPLYKFFGSASACGVVPSVGGGQEKLLNTGSSATLLLENVFTVDGTEQEICEALERYYRDALFKLHNVGLN